jgi:hypothetical protein
MGFEEKNTLIFLVVSALGAAIYTVILLARAQGIPLTEVAYAGPMLATIGGAIVAGIVGNIAVSMSTPHEKDFRDKEIAHFGMLMGQSFMVIGGVAALLLSIAQVQHFWISNALYLGFVLSALVGASARLIAYRRGLPR